MDEEDDDLYGPSESTAPVETKKEEVKDGDVSEGDEPMDEGDESGDDSSSSDDSDDVEFIIDRPPEAPKPAAPPKPAENKAINIRDPSDQTSTPAQAPRATIPQLQGQPGTAYPAVKSSSIDVNADPAYPALGKSILQVDIDADLAEASKPWRLPGADQSDYFNYGFDEFTWEMYRQRQQNMTDTLTQQKAETAQLQSFFGPGMGGPPGGNPATVPPSAPAGPAASAAGGGPPPAGPMGGMVNEDMMQQVMAQMMQQGIDPSSLDFNTFMQMAGSMGGGGFGGDQGQQQQQQQQQGGYGGGGGGGGRGGGRRGGRGRGGW
ncbi:hypothetical protein P280DRAFT_442240 [Massarina eburnea CBS 473.64]|uniref:Pre-mRNA polyadenylation factor Fip1 domain-containing protein n=1 Tax=Massarina eburnea CBS 473.64 TaxID=1395130 RepID=A0A6A6SDH0_9PLEO|nr:hypothetical protein P280DRAFT_442240 [Massarina eburnea CBS 473.64]